MFKTLLIANRGEIAIRVIRACRDLGIRPIAVFTEADRESRHALLADAAYVLNSGSYLDQAELLAVARQAGAEAVHPGYGFLAENAEFAAAVVAAGMTWVGPNPEAIAQMGSKLAARRLAVSVGTPIVPGLTDPVSSAEEVVAFADAHGYPVLIKAAAGGGGRGQAIANGEADVKAAFERAVREGQNYFGSGEVYAERFLTHPRHVEVQVVADRHGRVIHLGERDCSIQRRNQKLVEEAPSPAVSPAMRERLGAAAVAVASAVGYDSVGTVEFMVQDGEFFFLEMNTRIQVEHTVTELVYDCDLVAEMIRIAAGEPLSPELASREPRGWALQVRLNAEDPTQGYRPTPGKLLRYVAPEGPGVRVDGAAYPGWTIPTAYDSMIAKIITWGASREQAVGRMRRALSELAVTGVPTTHALHRVIMDNAVFGGGDFDTRFLETALSEAEWARVKAETTPLVESEGDAAPAPARTIEARVNGQRFVVELRGEGLLAAAPAGGGRAARAPKAPKAASGGGVSDPDAVVAPMMSRVVQCCVSAGDAVKAGQPVVIVEAMKMESELLAPRDGVVAALECAAGETVEQGKVLVRLG